MSGDPGALVVDTSAVVAIVTDEVGDSNLELVDVDPVIAERAHEGWRRFGKGRHPAGLNYGDCFTYGVAAELGVPVLVSVTTSPAPTSRCSARPEPLVPVTG